MTRKIDFSTRVLPEEVIDLRGFILKGSEMMGNPNDYVQAFCHHTPPFLQAIILPAIVASYHHLDHDAIWEHIQSIIEPEYKEKALEALQMLERWAREAHEMAERRRNPEGG